MRESISNHNDMCHHPNIKNSFEWWYFDFDLKENQHLYIEFHAPIFNLRDDHCMLIVRFYDHRYSNNKNNNKTLNDFTVKALRYPRTSVVMRSDIFQIQFPGGKIAETDNGYLIQINEDGLTANIALKKSFPIEKIIERKLFKTKDSTEYISWNVPLPVAKAEGSLNLEGHSLCIEGLAYHDHNWGNLNIGQHLEKWYWARVHFQKHTLIFADIFSRKVNESNAFCVLISEDGTIFETDSLDLTYDDFSNDTRYHLRFPQKAIILFNSNVMYRIELLVEKTVKITEAPLGSWRNNFLNSLITISYHLLKWSFLPNKLKKYLGRLVYLQGRLDCKLYIDNVLNDQAHGNFEVFSLDT